MITKISIPKLIFLFIITLGLYSLLWLPRRRNEIVETYKIPLPAWQWVILPVLIIPAVGLLAMFSLGLVMPPMLALLIAGLLVMLLLSVYLGVSIWWILKFGFAVERITDGRLTGVWVFLYWFFFGFGVMFVAQYFFNKLPTSTKLHPKPTKRPSKKFVTVSIIVFATVYLFATTAGVVVGVVSSIVDSSNPARDAQIEEIGELTKKADLLYKQYEHCATELNEKYAELTPEQVEDFNQEYDACEAVRIEQNAIVDQINKLSGDWWASLFSW